mmetsp:Transcript_27876/g.78168  ORF Transcript_27876/g.78168 Transcript_27876/m.78168 type:complete len:147 (-) Transcript_27876:32-472(-)
MLSTAQGATADAAAFCGSHAHRSQKREQAAFRCTPPYLWQVARSVLRAEITIGTRVFSKLVSSNPWTSECAVREHLRRHQRPPVEQQRNDQRGHPAHEHRRAVDRGHERRANVERSRGVHGALRRKGAVVDLALALGGVAGAGPRL